MDAEAIRPSQQTSVRAFPSSSTETAPHGIHWASSRATRDGPGVFSAVFLASAPRKCVVKIWLPSLGKRSGLLPYNFLLVRASWVYG